MSKKQRPLTKSAIIILKLLQERPHTRTELIINMDVPMKMITAAIKLLDKRELIIKKPDLYDMRGIIYSLSYPSFPDLRNS